MDFDRVPHQPINPLDYLRSYVLPRNSKQREIIFDAVEGYKELRGCLSSEYAVIVTGSDGKEEMHLQSKTDIVVLKRSGAEKIGSFLYKYISLQTSVQVDTDPKVGLFEYEVNGDVPLSYVDHNPHSIYPDYIFNSSCVWGNLDIHLEAKKRIIEEMTGNDKLGKKIREEMKEQVRVYRRASETGVYANTYVFNLQTGLQYYSEAAYGPQVFGFKMPFLRQMQRKLDRVYVRAMQKGCLSVEELVSSPPSTNGRLQFLMEKGILSKLDGLNAQLAYNWFLREYHKAQEAFKMSDKTSSIEVEFDIEEFKYYSEIIGGFDALL